MSLHDGSNVQDVCFGSVILIIGGLLKSFTSLSTFAMAFDASASGHPGAKKQTLAVPQLLVGKFIFYRGWCHKNRCNNASCSRLHDDGSTHARVPNMSFALTSGNEMKCTMRPPLGDAWVKVFNEKKVGRRICGTHERIRRDDGDDLVLFQLQFMAARGKRFLLWASNFNKECNQCHL